MALTQRAAGVWGVLRFTCTFFWLRAFLISNVLSHCHDMNRSWLTRTHSPFHRKWGGRPGEWSELGWGQWIRLHCRSAVEDPPGAQRSGCGGGGVLSGRRGALAKRSGRGPHPVRARLRLKPRRPSAQQPVLGAKMAASIIARSSFDWILLFSKSYATTA
jgi:hypothetical protein